MEYETKACSRCEEFKSLSEFYKQGKRHESLCKSCKKKTRQEKDPPQTSGTDINATSQKPLRPKFEDGERETMPVFDESIFHPEESCRAIGLGPSDLADLVAFVRWHMDQREKRLKKEKREP